jgi:L-lactate dehydrogenase complex protein LldG
MVGKPPMTEREAILGRIREALRAKAPRPGAHGDDGSGEGHPMSRVRQWLPLGGDTFEEHLERFRAASIELKTDFQFLDGRDAVAGALARLRDVQGWKRIASHRGELTQMAVDTLGLPVLWTDGGYDVDQLELCDAGITGCDALVAQTGSVLITSRSAGGRALSVLPPHHLVLARREQLLPDLPAAFELVKKQYAPDFPSMISLVTGPSRTGDIERILVLGAHGPRKLTVLCF